MKHVVITGCGFAGLETALWLNRLDSAGVHVSVVNRTGTMVYTPSLIWLPPQRKTIEEISIELEPVLTSKGIDFYANAAVSIDAVENRVDLADGRALRYDYLVLAAGWRSKKSHIAGGEHVLFPCDIPDALALTRAVNEMDGGSITIAIEGERPGPGAEYLGLIDSYLRDRGTRDRFELNMVEEKHRLLVHLGREACDLITENFQKRGINLYLGANLAGARPGVAVLNDGVEIPSDVICAVGKLEAPELLRSLEFSSEDGFIPVHDDLSCKAYPNIYVPGDANLFDTRYVPKVAQLAMEQGRIAAYNIFADIYGRDKQRFDTAMALKELYLMSDLGETSILAKNYTLIEMSPSVAAVKEGMERYYIYTHRLGNTWHPDIAAA